MCVHNFSPLPKMLPPGARYPLCSLLVSALATTITGNASNESLLIPRISIIPFDYPLQLKMIRFSVKISFVITTNKLQGHSLRFSKMY